MTPYPDVRVCLDCGWSEFSIPRSWLSAGWLRPTRPQPVSTGNGMGSKDVPALVT
jgi:hypothetical protein